LATTAGAVLREAQHPEECRSLLTLARLLWKRGEDGASLWRRSLDVLRTAPLIEPATRARWLAKVEVKLDRDGRSAEATEARSVTAADWKRLGFALEPVQHQVHDDACYAHVHPDR
jgi:hypothetical protein